MSTVICSRLRRRVLSVNCRNCEFNIPFTRRASDEVNVKQQNGSRSKETKGKNQRIKGSISQRRFNNANCHKVQHLPRCRTWHIWKFRLRCVSGDSYSFVACGGTYFFYEDVVRRPFEDQRRFLRSYEAEQGESEGIRRAERAGQTYVIAGRIQRCAVDNLCPKHLIFVSCHVQGAGEETLVFPCQSNTSGRKQGAIWRREQALGDIRLSKRHSTSELVPQSSFHTRISQEGDHLETIFG